MLESYVIRIYRRTARDPQEIVGLIEAARDGRQRRFSTMQELWQILMTSGNGPHTRRARHRKAKD